MYLEHNGDAFLYLMNNWVSPFALLIGFFGLWFWFVLTPSTYKVRKSQSANVIAGFLGGFLLIIGLAGLFSFTQDSGDGAALKNSLQQQAQETYGVSLSDKNAEELLGSHWTDSEGTIFGSTIVSVDGELVKATLVKDNGRYALMKSESLVEFGQGMDFIEFETFPR